MKHFDPYLKDQIFPHLEVCGNIANMMNFHVRPIWKKPTHLHMVLYHHAKFQKKTNKSISINHADNRTKERKDGRTNEWTDPIL